MRIPVLACLFLFLASLNVFAATPIGDTHTVNAPCVQGTSCVELTAVELTWDTPTEREDGTALAFNEISHYVIQYQLLNSDTVHTRAVAKSNAVVFRNLPSGTYVFRIATVDSDKNQGNFSPDITQTL